MSVFDLVRDVQADAQANQLILDLQNYGQPDALGMMGIHPANARRLARNMPQDNSYGAAIYLAGITYLHIRTTINRVVQLQPEFLQRDVYVLISIRAYTRPQSEARQAGARNVGRSWLRIPAVRIQPTWLYDEFTRRVTDDLYEDTLQFWGKFIPGAEYANTTEADDIFWILSFDNDAVNQWARVNPVPGPNGSFQGMLSASAAEARLRATGASQSQIDYVLGGAACDTRPHILHLELGTDPATDMADPRHVFVLESVATSAPTASTMNCVISVLLRQLRHWLDHMNTDQWLTEHGCTAAQRAFLSKMAARARQRAGRIRTRAALPSSGPISPAEGLLPLMAWLCLPLVDVYHLEDKNAEGFVVLPMHQPLTQLRPPPLTAFPPGWSSLRARYFVLPMDKYAGNLHAYHIVEHNPRVPLNARLKCPDCGVEDRVNHRCKRAIEEQTHWWKQQRLQLYHDSVRSMTAEHAVDDACFAMDDVDRFWQDLFPDPDVVHPMLRELLYLIHVTSSSVMVHGAAGTGKTYLLRQLFQVLRRLPGYTKESVVYTASMGAPALLYDQGQTLHSLVGLRPGDWDEGDVLSQARRVTQRRGWSLALQRMRRLRVLVIDEFSFLPAPCIDLLDHLLRLARHEPTVVFGGVQIIWVGDILQCAPIGEWMWYSKAFRIAWPELVPVILTTNFRMRVNSQELLAMPEAERAAHLQFVARCARYRLGYRPQSELRARVVTQDTLDWTATRLVATNAQRRAINARMWNRFREAHPDTPVVTVTPFVFRCGDRRRAQEYHFKGDVEASLSLCVGLPLLLLYNCLDDGVANGSQLIVQRLVTAAEDGAAFDTWLRGLPSSFPVATWQQQTSGVFALDTQVRGTTRSVRIFLQCAPHVEGGGDRLCLHWGVTHLFAITAHKCQGMTLRGDVLFDARGLRSRAYGVAYTAISRIQRLSQLHLLGSVPRFTVSTKALRFLLLLHQRRKTWLAQWQEDPLVDRTGKAERSDVLPALPWRRDESVVGSGVVDLSADAETVQQDRYVDQNGVADDRYHEEIPLESTGQIAFPLYHRPPDKQGVALADHLLEQQLCLFVAFYATCSTNMGVPWMVSNVGMQCIRAACLHTNQPDVFPLALHSYHAAPLPWTPAGSEQVLTTVGDLIMRCVDKRVKHLDTLWRRQSANGGQIPAGQHALYRAARKPLRLCAWCNGEDDFFFFLQYFTRFSTHTDKYRLVTRFRGDRLASFELLYVAADVVVMRSHDAGTMTGMTWRQAWSTMESEELPWCVPLQVRADQVVSVQSFAEVDQPTFRLWLQKSALTPEQRRHAHAVSRLSTRMLLWLNRQGVQATEAQWLEEMMCWQVDCYVSLYETLQRWMVVTMDLPQPVTNFNTIGNWVWALFGASLPRAHRQGCVDRRTSNRLYTRFFSPPLHSVSFVEDGPTYDLARWVQDSLFGATGHIYVSEWQSPHFEALRRGDPVPDTAWGLRYLDQQSCYPHVLADPALRVPYGLPRLLSTSERVRWTQTLTTAIAQGLFTDPTQQEACRQFIARTPLSLLQVRMRMSSAENPYVVVPVAELNADGTRRNLKHDADVHLTTLTSTDLWTVLRQGGYFVGADPIVEVLQWPQDGNPFQALAQAWLQQMQRARADGNTQRARFYKRLNLVLFGAIGAGTRQADTLHTPAVHRKEYVCLQLSELDKKREYFARFSALLSAHRCATGAWLMQFSQRQKQGAYGFFRRLPHVMAFVLAHYRQSMSQLIDRLCPDRLHVVRDPVAVRRKLTRVFYWRTDAMLVPTDAAALFPDGWQDQLAKELHLPAETEVRVVRWRVVKPDVYALSYVVKEGAGWSVPRDKVMMSYHLTDQCQWTAKPTFEYFCDKFRDRDFASITLTRKRKRQRILVPSEGEPWQPFDVLSGALKKKEERVFATDLPYGRRTWEVPGFPGRVTVPEHYQYETEAWPRPSLGPALPSAPPAPAPSLPLFDELEQINLDDFDMEELLQSFPSSD